MSVIESLMAISCIASHQYWLMPSLSPNCCSIQAQRLSKETNQGSWGGGAYQEQASWDSVADALTVFLGLLNWSTVAL